MIYLAGPMIFWKNHEAVFKKMKLVLQRLGLEGVSPLDNQIGLESKSVGVELSLEIFSADVDLMNKVDAAIFCLDPFRRGTEMDPGTAFELGYCYSMNLPIVGWTSDIRPYPEKVAAFFKKTYNQSIRTAQKLASGGSSGSYRDPDDVLVHSDGMMQNLMIDCAILRSGGIICADNDWVRAFSDSAIHLKSMLSNQSPHRYRSAL